MFLLFMSCHCCSTSILSLVDIKLYNSHFLTLEQSILGLHSLLSKYIHYIQVRVAFVLVKLRGGGGGGGPRQHFWQDQF